MIKSLSLALLMATATGLSAGTPKDVPTNTLCPVLGEKVIPGKSPVVTVRGHRYYLCCAGCEAKLAGHPDQYLEKDGTPRNAGAKPGSGAPRR